MPKNSNWNSSNVQKCGKIGPHGKIQIPKTSKSAGKFKFPKFPKSSTEYHHFIHSLCFRKLNIFSYRQITYFVGKVAYLLYVLSIKGGRLAGPFIAPLIVGNSSLRLAWEDLGLALGELGALPTEVFIGKPEGIETFLKPPGLLSGFRDWSSSIRLLWDSRGVRAGLRAKTGMVLKCSTGMRILVKHLLQNACLHISHFCPR